MRPFTITLSIFTGHISTIHLLQAADSLALSGRRSCCFVGPSTLYSRPSWEPMRFVYVVFRRSALLVREWIPLGESLLSGKWTGVVPPVLLWRGYHAPVRSTYANLHLLEKLHKGYFHFQFAICLVSFSSKAAVKQNAVEHIPVMRPLFLVFDNDTESYSQVINFLSLCAEWSKWLSLTGVRVHVWWRSAGGTSSRAWLHSLDRLLAWTRNMGLF